MIANRSSRSSRLPRWPHADLAGENRVGGGEHRPDHDRDPERNAEGPDPEHRDRCDHERHREEQQPDDGRPPLPRDRAVDLEPGSEERDHDRGRCEVLHRVEVIQGVRPTDIEPVQDDCRCRAENEIDERRAVGRVGLVGENGGSDENRQACGERQKRGEAAERRADGCDHEERNSVAGRTLS